MNKFKVFLSFSVLLCCLSAQAQTQPPSCLTGAPEKQLDCVTEAFSKSEVLLNGTYNSVLSTLAEKTEYGNEKNFLLENMRSRLRISQRSWVYFRESQCELEAFGLLESQHVTATHVVCQTKMNLERTKMLRDYFTKFSTNINH